MIGHEDVRYQIFTRYGFLHGRDWTDPIDYQYFEKNWGKILLIK
ncbi:M15 family metallopeptidase [Sporofaciens musculi]|nr:M15 family metallopeptidase [Sporofaciens musculi]